MKTCHDCKRFIGIFRKESKTQYGLQSWNEFQCNRADIPPEQRTFTEQACMVKEDGIYRTYTNINNFGVQCACKRFIQKSEQGDLF